MVSFFQIYLPHIDTVDQSRELKCQSGRYRLPPVLMTRLRMSCKAFDSTGPNRIVPFGQVIELHIVQVCELMYKIVHFLLAIGYIIL